MAPAILRRTVFARGIAPRYLRISRRGGRRRRRPDRHGVVEVAAVAVGARVVGGGGDVGAE